MKLKLALVLSLSFFCGSILGQDKIFLKAGTKQEGKVIEVGTKEIKYRKKENPEGPIYTLSKDEIILIEYQNGYFDILNGAETKTSTSELGSGEEGIDFKRHALYINPAPLIYGQANAGYRFLFGKGNVGISANGVYNYSDGYNALWNELRMDFMGELLLHIIPTGQKRLMYDLGLGPNFGVSSYEKYQYDYISDPWGNPIYNSWTRTETVNYVGITIRNSMIFKAADWCHLGFGVDTGMRRYFPVKSNVYNPYQVDYDPELTFDLFLRPRLDFAVTF